MLLPELIEYIFALCSSKDRSVACQVSKEWLSMVIKVSSQLSPLGELYYSQLSFNEYDLYASGDYHLIVRLKRKYTDLFAICKFGDIDIVQLMITYGANDWNNGLLKACESGHIELANLMISSGADNWNIGLLGACNGGHLELAKLMISHGANDWNWGLFGACRGGHLELAQLMISLGANDWDDGLYGACTGGYIKLINLMISLGAIHCNWCKKSLSNH
jgi:ankyrin repeat protein